MFDINKILGTKKSTKLTELSMSKVFGKNPISDIIGNITKKPLHNLGASNKMQDKWKSFSIQKRNNIRKTHKDSDGDRIPNRFDCSPFNVMKQDTDSYEFIEQVYKIVAQKEGTILISFARMIEAFGGDVHKFTKMFKDYYYTNKHKGLIQIFSGPKEGDVGIRINNNIYYRFIIRGII